MSRHNVRPKLRFRRTLADFSRTLSDDWKLFAALYTVYWRIVFCSRAVTVENCHNSTIVLGVTKTAVNIIGCDSCTIFAVCGRISFRLVVYWPVLNGYKENRQLAGLFNGTIRKWNAMRVFWREKLRDISPWLEFLRTSTCRQPACNM